MSGPSLRRDLGRWDLTAIGLNMVVGAGIYLVPSEVAGLAGSWCPLAYLALGFFSVLVGLCFAELGSRFEGTGGPYLYAREAFGRFPAFEVGWMYWFTRICGQASVTNGLLLALGYYWPLLERGAARITLITVVTLALAAVNVRGVKQTAWLVDFLTVGKLLPLLLFVAVGIWFVHPARLVPTSPAPWSHLPAALLLLLFIFSGYEVIAVPAGESRHPRRHVPFAVIATVLAITALNTLVHVVAMGTVPDLASTATPLATSAVIFLGVAGALLMGVGSVVSIAGNAAGQILTSSRMLFALAESGDLPPFFAKIHRSFRTPANAVIFSSLVTLVLALSGSFEELAAVSAMARLIVYLAVCGATLVLRRPRYAGRVEPALFRVPLGSVLPSLALVFSAAIFLGASREELAVGTLALVGGAALFAASLLWGRSRGGLSEGDCPPGSR